MDLSIKKADQLFEQSVSLRRRADRLLNDSIKIYTQQGKKVQPDDRLLSRKEAIELLWFDSYPTLRSWEKKVRPLGYLRFVEDKILRSEVLRFLDDYKSGVVHRTLNKQQRRRA